MTYLQAINDVLVRLRETQVSALSENNYSSLIEKFVNDAKREVEDAWNWTALRSTIQVTTAASTFRYTLTGAGQRFRTISVFDDTNDNELVKAPSQVWMNQVFNGGNAQSGDPGYYDYNGVDSSGDPYVDLYPIPDGVFTLNFNLVVPQADLAATGTVITVPSWLVTLRAYAMAIAERGEDGGQSYNEAYQQYINALSDAISIDSSKVREELIWGVE